MEGPCMISTLISEQLGINCCVLMGANIANEIAVEKFSEATVGYREDKEIAQRWVQLFNTPYFQVSASRYKMWRVLNYVGILKNVVAIAAGFVDGLEMGNNTKAAIMRIGLVEIKAFSKLLFSSVKDSTFFESCGVADLITTCLGGRNRRVAEAFAKKNGKRSFDELEAEMLQNNTLVLHQHSRILAVLCRNVEDVMLEVSKKEKQAGIVPDLDIDTYMKAISAAGLETSLQTDYILKILGLGVCAETIVGNAMRRGISGGQKKRVTTGEMIAGPTKVLLMDEISTGLDSTTTFQIMSCLQQLAHIAECTMLVSLLQPAPEVFDLFDDMVLMAEGKVIYHGPCTNVLKFFENCGFKCPERKGITEFLQEVTSRKDQAQYWNYIDLPYSYISVDEFRTKFSESSLGQNLDQELFQPANKTAHGLSFSKYSVKKRDIFQACMAREWLLMKRNSFVYIVKCAQIGVIALITMTVFLCTNMELNMVRAYYILGSLFYALIRVITTGVAELGFSIRTFLCL